MNARERESALQTTAYSGVPNQITENINSFPSQQRVRYDAFYGQDQWTLKRLTLSGAIRYDHATSNYNETCIGPDLYVPVQNGGTSKAVMPTP